MVWKFPPFRSEQKRRTTSGGTPQFPNGFSGKLLFHLTFNRNFWTFLLHGKLPELSYSPITTDFVSAATITNKNVAVFAPANHIARSEKCVLPRPFLSSAKIKAATQKSTTALVKHYSCIIKETDTCCNICDY